jgi:hypothetical protein
VKLPGTDTKSDAIQVALEHVEEYSGRGVLSVFVRE